MRVYFFALDVVSFFLLYCILETVLKSRLWALCGLVFFVVTYSFPYAGMDGVGRPGPHHSVLRYTIGLVWLVPYFGDRERGPGPFALVAAGISLGLALLFSQEVGAVAIIVAALAIASGSLFGAGGRPRALREGGLVLAGLTVALLPWVVFFALRGALVPAVQNLFVYPRYVTLGYANTPFPTLAALGQNLRLLLPGVEPGLAQGRALGNAKLYAVPAIAAIGAIVLGVRFLARRRGPEDRIAWALVLLVGLLFRSALGRSDLQHAQVAFVPAVFLSLALLRRFERAVAAGIVPALSGSTVVVALTLVAAATAMRPPTVVVDSFLRINGSELKLRPFAKGFVPVRGIPGAAGTELPASVADETEALVAYIQSATAPGEPIIVFPDEAAYYFLADRPNASRYPYASLAVTHTAREEMVQAWEAARPRYLVRRDGPPADAIPPEVQLPELIAYIASHYQPEVHIGGTTIFKRRTP